jgi:hypothetical protein
MESTLSVERYMREGLVAVKSHFPGIAADIIDSQGRIVAELPKCSTETMRVAALLAAAPFLSNVALPIIQKVREENLRLPPSDLHPGWRRMIEIHANTECVRRAGHALVGTGLTTRAQFP